jgi:hypothetical protein
MNDRFARPKRAEPVPISNRHKYSPNIQQNKKPSTLKGQKANFHGTTLLSPEITGLSLAATAHSRTKARDMITHP